MASKLQAYAQMADHAARQITGSYQEWTAFLSTAGRLYKYPFSEQLLIYAQRPEATACAEYDFWNRRMRRYRVRGRHGQAVQHAGYAGHHDHPSRVGRGDRRGGDRKSVV